MQQQKSQLTQRDHKYLHATLYEFATAVDVGGVLVDRLFAKPKSRSIERPVQRLAGTEGGREIIAGGLFTFNAN